MKGYRPTCSVPEVWGRASWKLTVSTLETLKNTSLVCGEGGQGFIYLNLIVLVWEAKGDINWDTGK